MLNMVSAGIIYLLFFVVIIWRSTLTTHHDVHRVLESETLTPVHLSSETGQIPPSVSGRKAEYLYHRFIIQTANHYQIDPALIKAIIMAESGYNPRAVSKKGAKGLMQLMPGTAEALGVEDIFNPHQNITGGIQYFKHLVNRFNGDVKLALAAYNAGSRNVLNYNGVPPFRATRYYIQKVFNYYQLYKNQMAGETNNA